MMQWSQGMHTVQGPSSLFADAESDQHLMEAAFTDDRSLYAGTHISDLPSVILTNIFSNISNPRVRNSVSLTCRDWYFIERQTRVELSLRGNICAMHELPTCFQQITTLDLSQCSPWGSSLFQYTQNGEEIGNCLRHGFPNVTDLTVYVRDAIDIQMLAWIWPDLECVRLVRWHQKPIVESISEEVTDEVGNEIEGLLTACKKLRKLNLSNFYSWTEDIPPALQVGAATAANLQVLNLLKLAPNGFKAQEVQAITTSCPQLEELYIVCEFDHRLLDSVGDEALLHIATSCPRLRVLHLVDYNEWGAAAAENSNDLDDEGFAPEDAGLSRQGLEAMFKALPHVEDLVLYLSQNVRDVGSPFEVCAASCKMLRSLKLSHFQGVCGGPHPDGIARCAGLQELRLNKCGDLTDDSLKAISVGCPNLAKLGLRRCNLITKEGLNACVGNLAHSLKDVEVACCKLLPTAVTLKALEPIQATVKNLHLHCVRDDDMVAQEVARAEASSRMTPPTTIDSFLNQMSGFGPPVDIGHARAGMRNWLHRSSPAFVDADGPDEMIGARTGHFLTPHRLVSAKRRRATMEDNHLGTLGYHTTASNSWSQSSSQLPRLSNGKSDLAFPGNGTFNQGPAAAAAMGGRNQPQQQQQLSENIMSAMSSSPAEKAWTSLETLSLWIPVGEEISPLAAMGLGVCPALRELKVEVEGDGRQHQKLNKLSWGMQSLCRYPKLEKLALDLSEVTGFSLSAPTGSPDLSLWERHYLVGINTLQLTELEYWPPSDKEVNRRGLSLPAAGLLSQCLKLRKLFVHGTAHEHFLMMLSRCPCLRDVQLRGDYYPAPDTIPCQRFEAAVAKRGFPD